MTSKPPVDPPEREDSVLTIRIRRGHLLLVAALAVAAAGFALGRITANDEQPVLYGLPAAGADASSAAAAGQVTPAEPVDVGTEGSPALGPESAAVTMVEFIDFECPYCAAYARETFPRIVREYGDRIRYVSRAFPLDIHPNSEIAARAGSCADEQGAYWELRERLFADQDALARGDLIGDARELGLDVAEFEACLDSSRARESVSADLADGRAYGVTGTPTFFINGVTYRGNQPYEQLSAAIDEALAASQGSD